VHSAFIVRNIQYNQCFKGFMRVSCSNYPVCIFYVI